MRARAGGWVPGIGWVARYSDLELGDHWMNASADSSSIKGHDYWTKPDRDTFVIVTRWADGTEPVEPPPAVPDEEQWGGLVPTGVIDLSSNIRCTYITMLDPASHEEHVCERKARWLILTGTSAWGGEAACELHKPEVS